MAVDMAAHMLDLARYNTEMEGLTERIMLDRIDAKQQPFPHVRDAALDVHKAENPARDRRRSPLAHRLGMLARALPAKERLRGVVPSRLLDRWHGFQEGAPAQRPPLPEAVAAKLARHFETPNRALEALLGRSLPTWTWPEEAESEAR